MIMRIYIKIIERFIPFK